MVKNQTCFMSASCTQGIFRLNFPKYQSWPYLVLAWRSSIFKNVYKKLSTPVRPLAGCASSLPAAEAEGLEYDDVKVKEVKEVDLYSAFIEVPSLKALRYGSHSVTCKLHRTCLYLVSIHQMAHPQTEVADI